MRAVAPKFSTGVIDSELPLSAIRRRSGVTYEGLERRHEHIEAGDVVTLARQQHEAHQIAECIDERCNLCRQAAARLADGLILSPPFAPVPCWWTRM